MSHLVNSFDPCCDHWIRVKSNDLHRSEGSMSIASVSEQLLLRRLSEAVESGLRSPAPSTATMYLGRLRYFTISALIQMSAVKQSQATHMARQGLRRGAQQGQILTTHYVTTLCNEQQITKMKTYGKLAASRKLTVCLSVLMCDLHPAPGLPRRLLHLDTL